MFKLRIPLHFGSKLATAPACESPDLDSDFQLFDPDGSFAWLLLCFAGLFTSGWTLGGC